MSLSISTISRRRFVVGGLGAAVSGALASSALRLIAQKAAVSGAQFRASGKNAHIATQRLRNDVVMLSGSGGNIVVLLGKDGKVMVDSGLATSETQVSAALGALSQEPLGHLLNTHWHFDHTDGNAWMHGSGATIVAQENTRLRMSSRQEIPAFSIVQEASPVGARPSIVFAQNYELKLNGETIQMKRYTPAHTDSDVAVFFENANVLHTGDTWFNGYYPFIDYDGGGSIDGMVAASSENLALANAETVVVPGHGATGDRKDLVAFHEMLMEARRNVANLKKKGLPVEAAIEAKPTARFDEKLGGGFVSPELFTRLVYRGV